MTWSEPAMYNPVPRSPQVRFAAWPIVRSRLAPLALLLGFGNLVALALHQHDLTVALSVVGFAVPVVAGYETRRRGGTYGNALRTAWLTVVVSLVIVGIPLLAVGLLTGAQSIPVPPGMQLDATSVAVTAAVLAVALPTIMFIVWLVWIPFTLIGAWIAGEPQAAVHANVGWLPGTRLQDAKPPSHMLQVLDCVATVIASFDALVYILFRFTLPADAVLFPSGVGPPKTGEVVFMLGLAAAGLLFWPCIAWLAVRLIILVIRQRAT